MKAAAAALLMLLAGPALAGKPTDYAQQWPLQLASADSGAYRVVLDEAVYRAAQHDQLADIEVFDANGEPVPAALHTGLETPAEWRWLALDGNAERHGDGNLYLYTLPARIPVQQLDVQLPVGNSIAEWTVSSREPECKGWALRAGPWTGYRVAAEGSVEKSALQPLSGKVRDRYWRVAAEPAAATPPQLLLGYRPESLLFLAQGPGPYTLAAGSTTARRGEAPLDILLDALRRRHGHDWQPGRAQLGPGRKLRELPALAAPDAAARKRDWRDILLWAVLIGGALLVVGMAVWLLKDASGEKQPGQNPSAEDQSGGG